MIKWDHKLPSWYLPNNVHLVVAWKGKAIRDTGRHDDHNNLSRDWNGQFLFEALIKVFDCVKEDEAHEAQDESGDVGAGDVTEYCLDTLRQEKQDSVT